MARNKNRDDHKRAYYSWVNMKTRCTNTKTPVYLRYGGRGISFDPKWRRFAGFLEDMGDCPAGLTIERIDNNAGYSKENCRWATYKEQNENRSTSLYVVFEGKRVFLKNLAVSVGIKYHTLRQRLVRDKRTIDEAVSRTKLPPKKIAEQTGIFVEIETLDDKGTHE